jgi:hypothetical protein
MGVLTVFKPYRELGAIDISSNACTWVSDVNKYGDGANDLNPSPSINPLPPLINM